jgi:hypothetical protein
MKISSNFAVALLMVVLLLVIARNMYAQSSTSSPAQGNTTSTTERPDTGVYSGRDVYVPKVSDKKEPEAAATSFADGFLRDTRQHIGASVGVNESYTPNLPVANGTSALSLTSVFPQLFLNFSKKKFNFRVNYGLAYERVKEGQTELNSSSQNGSAALTYNLSGRKASLGFNNMVTSMYYDQGAFFGMYLTTPYLNGTNFNAQLYPDQQRLTRGTSGVNFSYRATKKTSVSAGVTYDVARYTGLNAQRANLLSGSLGASYAVTKWLSFTSNYSQNFYSTTQGLGTANIQNLQIGGLSSKLGRGWTISVSGGLVSTKTNGVARQITGSGLAAISKSSRSTRIDFSFNRGYYTAFPSSTVWSGDTANLSFLYRLSSSVNVHANSAYIRGSALGGPASIAHSTFGGAGLDYMPQRNLVISTNYFLLSQKILDVSFQQPTLHRYTVSAGITYYLPSIHPEKNR